MQILEAKTYSFRHDGELMFGWTIETDSEFVGAMDDFPSEAHCKESVIRHLKAWNKELVCTLNGIIITV
jgi:hypothetical protein